MPLPRSSTIVYCSLPLGHSGPYCEMRDADGTTRVRLPRFGARPLTSHDE